MEARRRKGVLRGRAQLERFGPNMDSEGRLWPPVFKYNPWTGETLKQALPRLPATIGRFGSASGLPVLDGGYSGLVADQPRKEPQHHQLHGQIRADHLSPAEPGRSRHFSTIMV